MSRTTRRVAAVAAAALVLPLAAAGDASALSYGFRITTGDCGTGATEFRCAIYRLTLRKGQQNSGCSATVVAAIYRGRTGAETLPPVSRRVLRRQTTLNVCARGTPPRTYNLLRGSFNTQRLGPGDYSLCAVSTMARRGRRAPETRAACLVFRVRAETPSSETETVTR